MGDVDDVVTVERHVNEDSDGLLAGFTYGCPDLGLMGFEDSSVFADRLARRLEERAKQAAATWWERQKEKRKR